MNKMLTHLNGYKREAVLAPLFKMLEATFDLFVPLVMADIVNVGITAHDFHYILVRCGILLLLAVVGLACSLTAQYFSAKAAVVIPPPCAMLCLSTSRGLALPRWIPWAPAPSSPA